MILDRARHPIAVAEQMHAFQRSACILFSARFFGRAVIGLTLTELLTTISVATILLLIGVPNFQDLMRSNRISTQANDLLTALTFSRSEALKRGGRVSVCASAKPYAEDPKCSGSEDWTQGWLVFVDEATNPSDVIIGEVLRVWPELNGSTLVGNAPHARFGSLGQSLGSVELQLEPQSCRTNQARLIDVNLAGRAKVSAVDCSN